MSRASCTHALKPPNYNPRRIQDKIQSQCFTNSPPLSSRRASCPQPRPPSTSTAQGSMRQVSIHRAAEASLARLGWIVSISIHLRGRIGSQKIVIDRIGTRNLIRTDSSRPIPRHPASQAVDSYPIQTANRSRQVYLAAASRNE